MMTNQASSYSFAFKRVFLSLSLFLGLLNASNAQLVGSGSGSNPTANTQPSEITTGGVTGDVNVFSGTFNTSYNLGTVKTKSGMSFTASISHSSTYTSGDNSPNVTGIPYGEGWSINIPTITISNEDYSKYTLNELSSLPNQPNEQDRTPNFTSAEAAQEGAIRWFSPQLNIPGVASGRLVYKRFGTSSYRYSKSQVYIFVLAEFESYIEAIAEIDDKGVAKWFVYTPDGKGYEFSIAAVSERSPTNQRNGDVMAGSAYPQSEKSVFLLSVITNKLGEQIEFKYVSGGHTFKDMFKAHTDFNNSFQPSSINPAIISPRNINASGRHNYIKSIESSIEKLVLEYGNLTPPSGSNLLPLSDTIPGDPMYGRKSVYTSAFSTEAWERYLHAKSAKISSRSVVSNQNPYVNTLGYSTINGPNLTREPAALIGGGGLKFSYPDGGTNNMNSGFLSSPRIGANLPAGDTYEVKYNVTNNNEGSAYLNYFDVNIATGTNVDILGDVVDKSCYETKYGRSVFTTFNQPAKWTIGESYFSGPLLGNLGNYVGKTFSNYFVMPNLSPSYNGFNIQIGPGNYDGDYSKSPALVSDVNQINPDYKKSYNNYFTNRVSSTFSLNSGGNVSPNFGIGAPWKCMQQYIINVMGGNNADPFKLKWFNATGVLIPPYANNPTMFSDKVALESVELIRYAQNPYVLNKAQFYVLGTNNTWALSSQMGFNYEIKQVTNFVRSKPFPSATVAYNEVNGTRNVVLLTDIQQLSVNPLEKYNANTTYPTTTFVYGLTTIPLIQSQAILTTQPILNTQISVITKIIDPLGKETSIVYKPVVKYENSTPNTIISSFHFTRFQYNPRPGETSSLINNNPNSCGISPKYSDNPYSIQTYMIVDSKSIVDGDNGSTRTWSYQYKDLIAKENGLYFSPVNNEGWQQHYIWDITKSYSFGFKEAVVTGPVGDKTEYYHNGAYSLFGKLNKVITKTANASIVSKQEFEWVNNLAYENAIFRLRQSDQFNKSDYQDYKLEGRPLRSSPLQSNYYPSVMTWLNSSGINTPEHIPHPVINNFLESKEALGIFNDFKIYFDSYFVFKKKETTTSYSTSGDGISVIKEFQYFDADYRGMSSSDGYKKLLLKQGQSMTSYTQGASLELINEPSWNLYSVKTYSPQVSDAYTFEENFYMWDLFNDATYNDLATGTTKISILKCIEARNYRNLPFEARTTKKASGENPIVNATYFTYKVYNIANAPSLVASSLLIPNTFPCGTDNIVVDKISKQVVPVVDAINKQIPMQFVLQSGDFIPFIPTQVLEIQTFEEYDKWGRSLIVKDVKGLRSKVVYNPYTGLITEKTEGFGLLNAKKSKYTYNPRNLLLTYTPIVDAGTIQNSVVFEYSYDAFNRKTLIKKNGLTTTGYLYSNFTNIKHPTAGSASKTFKQRTLGNSIIEVEYNSNLNGVNINRQTYIDPLGNKFANRVGSAATSGGSDITSVTRYDKNNRIIAKIRPFTGVFNGNVLNEIVDNLNQIKYEDFPRSKPTVASDYGVALTSTRTVKSLYSNLDATSIIANAQSNGITTYANALLSPHLNCQVSQVSDQDGKISLDYTNAFGQKIMSSIGGAATDLSLVFSVTLFHYDSHGNVDLTVNPKQQLNKYKYNYLNQLYEKETPDDGVTLNCYDKAGRLLGTRDNKGVMRFFVYDEFGRMIKQIRFKQDFDYRSDGLVVSSFFFKFSLGSPWLIEEGYESKMNYVLQNSVLEKEWIYDNYKRSSDALYTTNMKKYLDNSDITLQNGKLTQTIVYNTEGVPTEIKFYSYNKHSLVDWEISQFNENGVTSGNFGKVTRIDYPNYSPERGIVLSQVVDLNCDNRVDFTYTYQYESRLNKLSGISVNGYKVVSYVYDYANGLLFKKNFFGNYTTSNTSLPHSTLKNISGNGDQTARAFVFYQYDIRNRLKGAGNNLFKWDLFYDDNLPTRPANQSAFTSKNWNGNINASAATYNFSTITNSLYGVTSSITNIEAQNAGLTNTIYNYTYDQNNRLTIADAGNYAAMLGSDKYTFDKIGNIATEQRTEKENGTTATNNYAYQYDNTGNRLLVVLKNNNSDRFLSYDNNGNLITDSKKGLSNVVYDKANLPVDLDIATAGVTKHVKYQYGISDSRIFKSIDGSKKEYYVTDASGKTLAVYSYDDNKLDWFVNGADRVAKITDPYAESFSDAKRDAVISVTGNPYKQYMYRPVSEQYVPIMDYYLYDHLGNTRVTFRIDVPLTVDISLPSFNYTILYAADYYPYGKILQEFKMGGKTEKFLTTQHERDAETGLDYRGARFYDSDLGRFLSLDPMAAKYFAWSPYNYVLGNPLVFTDPTGRDNIFYILTLAGVNAKVVNDAIVLANSYFCRMGLDTEVKRAGEHFNIAKLDETDGINLIGNSISQIQEYINNPNSSQYWRDHGAEDPDFKYWTDGDNNPEVTKKGSSYGAPSSLAMISLEGFDKIAAQFDSKLSKAEILAWIMIHTAGHMSGYRHPNVGYDDQKEGFMAEGGTVRYLFTGKKRTDFVTLRRRLKPLDTIEDLIDMTTGDQIKEIKMKFQQAQERRKAKDNAN
jgi:RHS repeat-associated protein